MPKNASKRANLGQMARDILAMQRHRQPPSVMKRQPYSGPNTRTRHANGQCQAHMLCSCSPWPKKTSEMNSCNLEAWQLGTSYTRFVKSNDEG
jgi:hypothetical protein